MSQFAIRKQEGETKSPPVSPTKDSKTNGKTSSPSSTPPSTPTSTPQHTNNHFFSVKNLNDKHRAEAVMLLSQCEEMGLPVTLDDCSSALQGYGWNAEVALDALLNGHRAPPPPPTLKRYNIDEQGPGSFNIDIPPELQQGDEFLVGFEDGTTLKGKVRREDVVEFQKNNHRRVFRRLDQSPPPSPSQALKSVVAFDIDVDKKGYLKVNIPKDVKEGESFIIVGKQQQQHRCVCPPEERFPKNSRVLMIRYDNDVKPPSRLPKFRLFGSSEDEDSDGGSSDGSGSSGGSDGSDGSDGNDEGTGKGRNRRGRRSSQKRGIKQHKALVKHHCTRLKNKRIWLHPKNTPPLLTVSSQKNNENQNDEDARQEAALKGYVMLSSIYYFQQIHPELYNLATKYSNSQIDGNNTDDHYTIHLVCQMMAFNYAAHGDHSHQEDFENIYEEMSQTMTNDKRTVPVSIENVPPLERSFGRHEVVLFGWLISNERLRAGFQLYLWNEKCGDGKSSNTCTPVRKQQQQGVSLRAEDWSINPYPLCGVAGNMCGTPRLIGPSNNKNEKVPSCLACTRQCIHPKNPFQSIWNNDTTVLMPCNKQQQFRQAWNERQAIKRVDVAHFNAEDSCNLNCSVCQKVTVSLHKINRCGGCKMILYCSKACQQKDWSGHKKDCKSFKKFVKKEISMGSKSVSEL